MMLYNRKIIITILIIFSFALGALIILTLSLIKPTPSSPRNPSITPTITLVPTITPRPNDLSIIDVLPPQFPREAYLPLQKITVVFNEAVKPDQLKLEISPTTEVELKQGDDPKTVLILPQIKWQFGETNITILPATTSVSGKNLYAPYFYKMFSDIPSDPVIEYEHP